MIKIWLPAWTIYFSWCRASMKASSFSWISRTFSGGNKKIPVQIPITIKYLRTGTKTKKKKKPQKHANPKIKQKIPKNYVTWQEESWTCYTAVAHQFLFKNSIICISSLRTSQTEKGNSPGREEKIKRLEKGQK